MSSLISVTIDHLGTYPVHAEYTHEGVLADYAINLALLVNVFNKRPGTETTATISSSDYGDVMEAISNLSDLFENGKIIDGKQYFMNYDMAKNFQLIYNSLESADVFDAVGFVESVTALKRWLDLTDIGLLDIMKSAIQTLSSNKTLQAYLELEYVKAGNEQIFGALSQLQEATILTRDALNLLERLQKLHNMISPSASKIADYEDALRKWSEGSMSGSSTWDEISTVVKEFRSDFDNLFSTIIRDDFSANGLIGSEAVSPALVKEYLQARQELAQLITNLDNINGTYAGGPNEAQRPGSLAERLQNILNDMPVTTEVTRAVLDENGFPTGQTVTTNNSANALEMWTLDRYNSSNVSTAGNIQRGITDGITTAQSVNDQQRQELRRELFVFEEFYRSASAMLTNINRIIERLASNSSR